MAIVLDQVHFSLRARVELFSPAMPTLALLVREYFASSQVQKLFGYLLKVVRLE
jgi:hypothetical protein